MEENRARKWAPKSTTGCVTCKIRRIKCDEAKPSCLKCASTGRKCDGYPPSPTHKVSTTRLCRAPRAALFKTPAEKQTFDYFVRCTAPRKASLLPPQLWTRLVLQAAHVEPSIAHGVLCIGTLHRYVELAESGAGRATLKETHDSAMNHYSRALHHARALVGSALRPKRRSKFDVEKIVIVCLIFVCYCNLFHDRAVFMHLGCGLRILEQWALQAGISGSSGKKFSVLRHAHWRLFEQRDSGEPDSILGNAGVTLFDIIIEAYRRGGPIHPSDVPDDMKGLLAKKERCDQQLKDWDAQYQSCFEQPRSPLSPPSTPNKPDSTELRSRGTSIIPPTPATNPTILLLQINRHFAHLCNESSLFPSETSWDAHLPAFSSILSLSRAFLALTTPQSSPAPFFAFEMELLKPLALVAHKCRDPRLRRAAIALLREARRCEGHLTSTAAARVGEWVVEKEEGGREVGVAGDVCEEMRLRCVKALGNILDRTVDVSWLEFDAGSDGWVAKEQVIDY